MIEISDNNNAVQRDFSAQERAKELLASNMDEMAAIPSKTSENDPQLYYDTMDLLRGMVKGGMSKYAYRQGTHAGDPADGIGNWSQIVQNSELPANKERKLFEKRDSGQTDFMKMIPMAMPRYLNKMSIVEIGPGLVEAVQNKTCKLLSAFRRHANDIEFCDYVAVDIAPVFALDAIKTASRRFKDTRAIYADFTTLKDVGKLKGIPLAMIWGGTLWNAPTMKGVTSQHVIASHLETIGKALVSSSKSNEAYIAFTYYGQDTPEKWIELYSDPRNKKTVESILHVMAGHPKIAFDPKDFEIKIEYDQQENLVTMEAESTKDQKIDFSMGTKHLNKGERLVLVNAYRPTETEIRAIARNANCTVVEHGYDKDIGVGMFLFKYKPKMV